MSTMDELRSRINQRQVEIDGREQQRKQLSNEIRRRMERDEQRRDRRTRPKSSTPMQRAMNFLTAAVTISALAIIYVTSYTTVTAAIRDGMCVLKTATGIVSVTPLPDSHSYPEVFSAEHNRSLFWGTYRPHLLAGVRSREEAALLFGIAWYDEKGSLPVRHTAEDGDEVLFRWELHDGRWFGRETIHDRQNDIQVTVRFLKSSDGLGWRMQLDGVRTELNHPVKVVVYFATEHRSADKTAPLLQVEPEEPEYTNVKASDLEVGAFTTQHVLRVKGELATEGRRFIARVEDVDRSEHQWEVLGHAPKKDQWKMDLRRGGTRMQHFRTHKKPTPASGALVMRKLVTGGFSFAVTLRETSDGDSHHDALSKFELADYCQFSAGFAQRERRFTKRFDELFDLHGKIAEIRSQFEDMPSAATLEAMARSALSGVLGGIGYWHGDFRVQVDPKKVVTMPPATLFSGVPSRAKFPRGFLWDEGFHQLLVGKWDTELSKDVILHWIDGNLVDRKTGWIPREQILGAEPRTRVPDEFVAQHPTHTNPPAMVLQVETFANQAHSGDDYFLNRARPAVRRWLSYLRRQQCGGSPDCSENPLSWKNASMLFRWRSRNNYHLLASGLDDYPRPTCKPDWKELHLDLYCWAAMMSNTVRRLENEAATSAGADDLPSESQWRDYLDTIYWDKTRKRHADVTGCSGKDNKHSKFVGYVSLFPMLTAIVEDKEKAAGLVRLARKELLGNYGLQSLSNSSRKMLKQHDDYWTGPIWLNLNYLMLRALKTKYIDLVGEEAQALYTDLRHGIVRNVGAEFERTGKVWENYDQGSGRGRGTAPFTGWSALVVAMLAEQY